MLNKYVQEKEKHKVTKKVLDKAIGLASVLLKEIQQLELKQNPSMLRIS